MTTSDTIAKDNPFADRVLRVAWYRGFAEGHLWADDHRPGTLAAIHPQELPGAASETRDLTTVASGPVPAAWSRGATAGKAHWTRRGGWDESAYRYALERGEGRGLTARSPNPSRACAAPGCGRPIAGRTDRKTCGPTCRKALSRAEVAGKSDIGQIGQETGTAPSQIGVTPRRSEGFRTLAAQRGADGPDDGGAR